MKNCAIEDAEDDETANIAEVNHLYNIYGYVHRLIIDNIFTFFENSKLPSY